jgi:hypothetical protein
MNSFIVGVSVVVAVAIADIVLSSKWNELYFTVGLPVFKRRVERRDGLAGVSLDELSRSSTTAAAAPLAFRQLQPNVIGFRERVISQYVPIMHGVIRHDPAEGSVSVAGLVNWFVVAALVVLAVTLRRGIVVVAPYILGALGILYFIQAVRFNRVAKQLRS